MNFYINIEKLKNLKISQNKDSENRKTKSSYMGSNPYLNRDKMHVERRSDMMKRYNMNRKHYQSQDKMVYESASKVQYEKDAKQNRSRGRYKTELQEEVSPPVDVSNKHAQNAIFKRAHNEMILKDRTFIEGYLRGKQLGRGGFSKVW